MKDAAEVLDVARNADVETVRKRYLELVRQFPPDQFPERFAEVRAAYDDLRDPVRRLERELFSVRDDDSLDQILDDTRRLLRGTRVPVETLLSLGAD